MKKFLIKLICFFSVCAMTIALMPLRVQASENPTPTVTPNHSSTVKFDSQGGSSVSAEIVDYDSSVAKPADPIRTGYTFDGWYTEPECINVWDFANGKVTGDVTCYAKWTATVLDNVYIDSDNFPDANFRTYVKTLLPDATARGYFTQSEINGISSLYCESKGISSLKGVEFFTSLTYLDCPNNELTSLDVSKNTALTYLYCNDNQLTSLDVGKNTALTSLFCDRNQLTSLDVSKNTVLTSLFCDRNQLTSLDVSKNTALTNLFCDSNQLTSLDVSKNTALTDLYCYSNQLISLDTSKNTHLKKFDCYSNKLTSLDVSGSTSLTSLYCFGNQLTSLDVSKNISLTDFDCSDNQLTSLDLSANKKIDYLKTIFQTSYYIGNAKNGFPLSAIKPANVDTSRITTGGETTLENNILKPIGSYSYVWYSYDTGLANKRLDVTVYFYTGVTSISVPYTETTVGTKLSLYGNVYPDDATNKSINWSIKDAGTTGATLENSTLSTKNTGTVVVTAKIANGKSRTEDYAQDFSIDIKPIPRYVIHFDGNGATSGTMVDETMVYDTVSNLSTNTFTKIGYTFTGWKDDKGNTYTDNQSVKNLSAEDGSTVTFTALWSANPNTIKFDSQGGSSVSAEIVDYDSSIAKPADPTRTGYTFGGWYTEPECTNAWNFETWKITGDMTLYAKWTVNQYTVKFDSQGGSSVSTEIVDYGSSVAKPADPTRTGYTFGGWYMEPSYTNAWDFETGKVVTGDMTLYAKWTANQCTVKFDSQGGSSVSAEIVDYDSSVAKPADPTRTGYTFGGWYTESGCTNAWDFANGKVTGDMTLYAKWTATPTSMYRLYNPNSGEHFYTAAEKERNDLISYGWIYEGIGWTAPSSSNTPVYRLYNPVAGEHHYTMNANERDSLLNAGWLYEGIGWYSDDAKKVPLYRQYNRNAFACNHNYTTNVEERNFLVGIGWLDEGIAWYGIKK
jgi:uncharacterized repeat protein (TIGR02543 family)